MNGGGKRKILYIYMYIVRCRTLHMPLSNFSHDFSPGCKDKLVSFFLCFLTFAHAHTARAFKNRYALRLHIRIEHTKVKRAHTRKYTHTRTTHTDTRVQKRIHTDTHTDSHIRTHIHSHIRSHIHSYTNLHAHTNIYERSRHKRS